MRAKPRIAFAPRHHRASCKSTKPDSPAAKPRSAQDLQTALRAATTDRLRCCAAPTARCVEPALRARDYLQKHNGSPFTFSPALHAHRAKQLKRGDSPQSKAPRSPSRIAGGSPTSTTTFALSEHHDARACRTNPLATTVASSRDVQDEPVRR